MLLTVALIPSQSGEDGAMKWFCLLLMSAALSAGGADRPMMPEITGPVLFNTPETDKFVAALQTFPLDNPWNDFEVMQTTAPNHGNSAEFRAGTARSKITPEDFGWLGGYGHRNRPAEGVAADLWARALALEDKLGHRRVLVNADIHIFTRRLHREIVEAARKRFGLEQSEVMLIATHTHSGPALPEGFDPIISWGLDERELRKLQTAADRIRDQTLDAMARALSGLRPARISFARRGPVRCEPTRAQGRWGICVRGEPGGRCGPRCARSPRRVAQRSRRLPWCSPTPATIRRSGTVTMVSIAITRITQAWPLSRSRNNSRHNRDLRDRCRGGDRSSAARRSGAGEATWRNAECRRARHSRPDSPASSSRGVAYVVPGDPAAAEYGPFRAKYVELSAGPVVYRQRHARHILAQMDAGTLPAEVPLPIQIWWFGNDLTLIALGGEVGVDYALRLKRDLGADRVWPVAYANEVPCYIPSARVLKEGGYEAGWDLEQGPGVPGATGNILFYGWAAPLAPGVEDRVLAALHSLLKK